MLQSFILILLLFLVFHLIIYFLLTKEKRSVIKYVRFYTITAAISALYMVVSMGLYAAVIPMIIYFLSFNALGKILKKEVSQK